MWKWSKRNERKAFRSGKENKVIKRSDISLWFKTKKPLNLS